MISLPILLLNKKKNIQINHKTNIGRQHQLSQRHTLPPVAYKP